MNRLSILLFEIFLSFGTEVSKSFPDFRLDEHVSLYIKIVNDKSIFFICHHTTYSRFPSTGSNLNRHMQCIFSGGSMSYFSYL